MKKRILRYIGRSLQKSGIEIGKFPTVEQVYKQVQNEDAKIRICKLNRVCKSARLFNNQRYYNDLLKQFIPGWDAEIKNAVFIGSGIGQNSLNIFRKVQISEGFYFEKVYSSASCELSVIEWFERFVYDVIKEKIKVPKVWKIFKGSLLSIVYFEYLDLRPLPTDQMEDSLVMYSVKLYKISANKDLSFLQKEGPECIGDYRNHFQCQRYFQLAKKRLLGQQIDFEALKILVSSSRKVLTHGDIQETNVFEGCVLLDWDSFGIFPVGLDPAYLYYKLLVFNKVGLSPVEWLIKHYKSEILKKDWIDFQRNFIYFLYIFSAKRFKNGQFKELEVQLIYFLKKC